MQLIGIVLLYLVGLSGSDDIIGKKRASLSIRITTILQVKWLANNAGSELWITSLNPHSTPRKPGTKCSGWLKIAKVWIKVCNLQFQVAVSGG